MYFVSRKIVKALSISRSAADARKKGASRRAAGRPRRQRRLMKISAINATASRMAT